MYRIKNIRQKILCIGTLYGQPVHLCPKCAKAYVGPGGIRYELQGICENDECESSYTEYPDFELTIEERINVIWAYISPRKHGTITPTQKEEIETYLLGTYVKGDIDQEIRWEHAPPWRGGAILPGPSKIRFGTGWDGHHK